MKKLIYVLFIFGLMAGATSCKKDSEPGTDTNYYVKIKKDGTWYTWTKYALGEMGPDGFDPNNVDLGVDGMSDDMKDRFNITMQKQGTSFSTGTYDSDNIYTLVDFITNANTMNPSFYRMHENFPDEHSRYVTTITAITETTIEGSFTGNYLVNDMSSGERVNITEGSFRVKRLR